MKYVKLFLLTVVVLCSFSNEKIPKIDLPATLLNRLRK